MVFCGRPSKGCSNCRARRIKCDQIEPSCSQCLRAQKDCPGYRDQLALAFRDECKGHTKSAYSKASERTAQSQTSKREIEGPSSKSPSPGSLVHPQTYALSVPILDDEGIHFFFAHYVTILYNPGTVRSIEHRTSPLWEALFRSPLFANTVSSVGFAGLFNVTNKKSHMIVARKKYAVTLREIKQALADVSKGDLGGTFYAVLLLAAYELVNGNSGESGDWGTHVDGGVALLKIMNARKSKPHIQPAVRMQVQFRFSQYIKCLPRGEAAPTETNRDFEHDDRIPAISEIDQPAADLAEIVARYTNLSATVRNSSITSNRIVEEALALERELNNWQASLPDIWQFTTTKMMDRLENTFDGFAHSYRDLWTARIWNNFRWARILVNELVVAHMAQRGSTCPAADEDTRKRSVETIVKMATDICRSVHSQFCKHAIAEARLNGVPPMSGCFLLLFPLSVAGSALGVPEEVHNFTITMLEKFGNIMGIKQALTMIPLTKAQRARWKNEEIPRAGLGGKPLPRDMSFYDAKRRD